MGKPWRKAARHAIFTVAEKKLLGTGSAMYTVSFDPMNRTQQHQRSLAGASYSKACVSRGCAAMRPEFSNWIKNSGAGSQA